MRVVITGCESFIGRELIKQCCVSGIQYVGIDVSACSAAGHIPMDIRSPDIDEAIPTGADVLIHLAAISRDEDCRRDTLAAFDVNVGGTMNLIRAARARAVRQFVFASSEWVYGEVANDASKSEETVIDVNRISSEYALTKIVGERTLTLAFAGGPCAATVLRFGIVYGPRLANWSAVEALFDAVATKDVVEIKGSARTARRFIHVTDVAAGILAALGRQGHETFNLSGDTLVSLGDIIKESAAILGRSPKVVERDPSAISIRNPSNTKARDVLGWRPAIGLRQGLMTLLPAN